MLSSARAPIRTAPAMMSPGPWPSGLPEHGQVVGHEVGRDRDRDRVVEHLPPGGDEADQLVEGVAGEARGAAGLGVHHGRLGVGGGGRGEDQAGDDEGDRGQAEGEGGGDAEGVVDRGADVAVGRREQRADAVDTAQRFVSGDPLGQLRYSTRIYGCGRCALHVGWAELGRRPAAAEGERQLQLGAEQLEHPQRPRLAPGREPPESGPSDQDRVGAEGQRDRDVDPAPDPAVDEDRGPAGDGVDHLGQRVGGREAAVELAAAVVGDDDPGGAVLDRERRVLAGQDALDQDRNAGLGRELLELGPVQRRLHQVEGLGDRQRPPAPIAASALGTPRPSGIAKPVRMSRSRLPPRGASTVRTIAS